MVDGRLDDWKVLDQSSGQLHHAKNNNSNNNNDNGNDTSMKY